MGIQVPLWPHLCLHYRTPEILILIPTQLRCVASGGTRQYPEGPFTLPNLLIEGATQEPWWDFGSGPSHLTASGSAWEVWPSACFCLLFHCCPVDHLPTLLQDARPGNCPNLPGSCQHFRELLREAFSHRLPGSLEGISRRSIHSKDPC